jgi:hypothetical protein
LKAIFPLDAGGCYGGLEGFRDQHPGGVIQTMPYHIGLYNTLRTRIGTPPELPPPAHAERPFHAWRDEMLRCYDHWLKGIDNGVDKDPAVRVWVMGENRWRSFDGWPVPGTQWTKYYLYSWEQLQTRGHLPAAHTFVNEPPDAFVQMPPTQTNRIERLRYLTELLAEDLLVVGPIALRFWASMPSTPRICCCR